MDQICVWLNESETEEQMDALQHEPLSAFCSYHNTCVASRVQHMEISSLIRSCHLSKQQMWCILLLIVVPNGVSTTGEAVA